MLQLLTESQSYICKSSGSSNSKQSFKKAVMMNNMIDRERIRDSWSWFGIQPSWPLPGCSATKERLYVNMPNKNKVAEQCVLNLKRLRRGSTCIPHHGVYHPQKGKLCAVFNCTATFQSTSLNAELLQGPDFTSSLIGVLASGFRKEPVVLMADIKSIFHQVRVLREDPDLLRFLWWPNGDWDQDLVDLRIIVHLFGTTYSPSCANFSY